MSETDFWLYASAADICLNLRYPSAGETSATLLRLLAAGRAVMITHHVRELDFPDSGRPSEPGWRRGRHVMDLLRNPERRRRLEDRAREYIRSEHSPDAMLEDYVRCLEEMEELPSPSIDLPHHLS